MFLKRAQGDASNDIYNFGKSSREHGEKVDQRSADFGLRILDQGLECC